MSATSRWSVHVVTDDPSGSVPDALRALEAMSPPPDSVVVVDNAPAGKPRPEIAWPVVRWLRNPRPQSVGHCHNQAIEYARHASSDGLETIVLFLTPDVIVGTDLLAKLQATFEADARIVCAGPVVCRAHVVSYLDGERRELEFTDVIDSAGVSVGFFRRAKPIARGQKKASFEYARVPFGPSPSCFALRLSALKTFSSQGPWLLETGLWERVAIRLFRDVKAAGFALAVVGEAPAWRLAPRDV